MSHYHNLCTGNGCAPGERWNALSGPGSPLSVHLPAAQGLPDAARSLFKYLRALARCELSVKQQRHTFEAPTRPPPPHHVPGPRWYDNQ